MGEKMAIPTSKMGEIKIDWIRIFMSRNRQNRQLLFHGEKVEDCPLMSRYGLYCIMNDDGIVPAILDKDMWITFNRSVAKTYLSLSNFKQGILPIHQIHIGEETGPILAVYSQSMRSRVGVEKKNMQNVNNNSFNNDLFVTL
uniref:Ubiquitin-like domain-containing protein n=1 Tax=Romanomermis culicivorax TaxID=13658 RepID=A0A915IIS5_ROMCU